MMGRVKKYIKLSTAIIWSSIITVCSILMINITIPYTSWEWDVDFLQTKFEVVHLLYYRMAFYIHIFTSCVVLFTGLFLFCNYILRKWSKVHKLMGKTYVGLVLLFSAPSGLIMAFHANGGMWAKLSFILLTTFWWWFTYKGYTTARAKEFSAHKKWMIRSYALTFSAITLRLSQMVLGIFFYLDPVFQYILVSWTSWTVNLFVAEIIIKAQYFKHRSSRERTQLTLIKN